MNTITETHMSRELLDKLPEWCKDLDPKQYYLVLTDDADSLLSAQRLKTKFGLEIGGFYDFKQGLFAIGMAFLAAIIITIYIIHILQFN